MHLGLVRLADLHRRPGYEDDRLLRLLAPVERAGRVDVDEGPTRLRVPHEVRFGLRDGNYPLYDRERGGLVDYGGRFVPHESAKREVRSDDRRQPRQYQQKQEVK